MSCGLTSEARISTAASLLTGRDSPGTNAVFLWFACKCRRETAFLGLEIGGVSFTLAPGRARCSVPPPLSGTASPLRPRAAHPSPDGWAGENPAQKPQQQLRAAAPRRDVAGLFSRNERHGTGEQQRAAFPAGSWGCVHAQPAARRGGSCRASRGPAPAARRRSE